MSPPLLDVNTLTCSLSKGQPVFENISFAVEPHQVVVLTGKSGSGKTTLLKCLAHLNTYTGEIQLNGSSPQTHGIPLYRTRVQYVPQRPSLLPGSPRDFLHTISTFSSRSQKGLKKGNDDKLEEASRPFDLARKWGVDEDIWDRAWTSLSGGESQRVLLAIAVGLGTAEVLLLDEPTSALDPESSNAVEQDIILEVKKGKGNLRAVVWITHSLEQAQRVGTRFLHLVAGGCREVNEARAPDV